MNNDLKLNGRYRGKVLTHLPFGQCKIYIPGIYPQEWNSADNAYKLPTAQQATPIFGGNANATGNGIFSYPDIGATVWCFFENGDQNYPVYFATTQGGSECKTNFTRAKCLSGGHPNDAYTHIIHVGANNKDTYVDIEMLETGNLHIKTTKGGLTCRFDMDDAGNITLESTKTITLKTNCLILEGTQQVDIKSQRINEKANIGHVINSPSIELDSTGTGMVTVKSQMGGTKAI